MNYGETIGTYIRDIKQTSDDNIKENNVRIFDFVQQAI